MPSETDPIWEEQRQWMDSLSLWDDPADGREIELFLSRIRSKETWTVVVLAGGGYRFRAWHEGPGTGTWLAMRGISAAVVPYRVAEDRQPDGSEFGEGVHPQPLRDACRAIRVVRDHAEQLRLNPDKIAVLGYSAGGHLAGSAALLHEETREGDDLAGVWSGRPDAAAMVYPVVSLVPPFHGGSANNLLGLDSPREIRERSSLQFRVTEQAPPIFLAHTADDPVVPMQGVLDLASACRAAGTSVSCHVFPEGGHGYGLGRPGQAISEWPSLFLGWLETL